VVEKQERMLPPIARRIPTGWGFVAGYLAVALVVTAFEVVLLKKSSPSHLTIGAALTLLLYLTVGGFLIGATRLFVNGRESDE
jgi:hypothetical protein